MALHAYCNGDPGATFTHIYVTYGNGIIDLINGGVTKVYVGQTPEINLTAYNPDLGILGADLYTKLGGVTSNEQYVLKGSSATWYWYWSTPASQAGTYSYVAELWWDNSGTQVLEDTKSFSILVVELKISNWQYSQTTVQQGSTTPAKLTITFTNGGNDDMSNVELEVIDAAGLNFQSYTSYLGSIAAGATKSSDFYVTAPADKPVGSYSVRFRVSYDDFRGVTHTEDKAATVSVVLNYDYTVSVSGTESYSVDVYLDGTWKTNLKNGGSYTFTGLSGTHTVSVSNIISISSGARLLCEQSSITVSSSGSYNFQYKKQYYLSISVKPLDSGTTSKSSGWYDAGTSITIIAKPNSGYQFRGWIGDVSSSSDTITINVNSPMSVTAWFGKQNIISCKLSQTVVTRLNTLKISGSIYPSPGYSVNVKVNFILPSGSTKVVTTSTDSNGNYEVSFVPDIKGVWQVYASWEGDESFSPSKSEVTSFMVNPIVYSFSIDSNIKSPNIVLVVDNEKVSSTQLPKIYRFEEFTSHTIHVESSYFEQEGVKYIFDSWSDSGKKELDRSFTMDRDISVKAIFIKQYYLKIISNFGNVEGEGWYDEGTYAYARLDKDEFPAEDVFHVYKFVRWTRDATGNSLTSDPILMDSPKVAEAVWEKRFSLLFYLVIIGAIAMATILPVTYSKNLRIKVSNKIKSLMITRKKPEPPKVEGTMVKELPFTKEQIEKIVNDIEERTTSYKSYIEKSENLHKEGKISDSVFETLKNEYNSKIEELNKLKEQIEKEGKISETNYSKLKDLGLIKES
jgi:hypothetical protein